jgi:hypothetical protein
MTNTIGEKCYEIRCEYLEKIDEMERTQNCKPKKEVRNELKNERKNITQNILAYHRSSSFNSFGHHRSQELEKFTSENELPQVSEYEERVKEVGSIELNSIQSKMSALEETQNQKLKETLDKIEKKFE